MSNFYLVDGFWKDSDLCFYGELVTDGGNYDPHCKYPFSDIFAFGFNPDNLDDKNSEFVITRYHQIDKKVQYKPETLSTCRRKPSGVKDDVNVVRVNTSAWEEEDFYVLSTLTEYQIRVVILAMVLKERASGELLYDNEDYIAALQEAYPMNVIKWYANFDTITI
jgi:hypothetical protein